MSLVRDQPPGPPVREEPDHARSPTRRDDDGYSWALEQAALLREGRLGEIDADQIADEISDVAHYLADKLHSDLVRVIQHLLKWDYQPERRSRSWVLTIREHRRRVAYHLKKAPGLRSLIPELVAEAFQNARDEALNDTDLPESVIPVDCCYTWTDIAERPIEWPM
jgi:hypothetical protein